MCGIFFTYSSGSEITSTPCTGIFDRLHRRGPDHIGKICIKCSNGSLRFVSSVLSLRGEALVRQPLQDPYTGSVLCWNGEIWRINTDPVCGNDTEAVFDLLLNATASTEFLPPADHKDPVGEAVVNALSRLSGPYAFIYYDARHSKVFFGRDPLGRRSLMVSSEGSSPVVSSVPSGGKWTEVDANGIYVLSTNSTEGLRPLEKHIPWPVTGRSLAALRLLKNTSPPDPIQASMLGLSVPAVDALLENLRRSLALRILAIPPLPSNSEASTKLAVLFSGGLDCTLLARIAHNLLPLDQEVDLLNVAFENPRVLKAAGNTSDPAVTGFSQCPDRITGLKSHAEMQRVCPGRQWRFVAIDVTYAEFMSHRPQIVSLIYPHQTEMDLSIACALYFAARGSGFVRSGCSPDLVPYTTSARVLISGLGADELFAGYTRHATAFARQGYEGLADELELDYQRLGNRNLGRDDRVISDWAREVRYPYLDEDFLRWVLSLPIWEKCGFGQPEIATGFLNHDENPLLEPSKKLLRLLLWKLGMKFAAAEKKRAIQFGARSAKMEVGKTKGTQIIS